MQFSNFAIEYLCNDKKVHKTVFVCSYGAQIESFKPPKKWLKISWHCSFNIALLLVAGPQQILTVTLKEQKWKWKWKLYRACDVRSRNCRFLEFNSSKYTWSTSMCAFQKSIKSAKSLHPIAQYKMERKFACWIFFTIISWPW